ncbi:LexA family protein [Cupriavidus basilensis]
MAAGSPILAAEHIDRQYQVDASVFDERPDYLLRVRGLSMRDAGILDGDLLAVRKASEAPNGKIVVASPWRRRDRQRLQRRDGAIELIAENPDFPNIVVTPGREEFSLERHCCRADPLLGLLTKAASRALVAALLLAVPMSPA